MTKREREKLKKMRERKRSEIERKQGSGCGTVDSAVASYARGPWFKSSQQ